MAESTAKKDAKKRNRILKQYRLEWSHNGKDVSPVNGNDAEQLMFSSVADARLCKAALQRHSPDGKKASKWFVTEVRTKIEPKDDEPTTIAL